MHTDDSTLVGVVPFPDDIVAVAESLNRDMIRVSKRCGLWEMKLNYADKTRSRTIHFNPVTSINSGLNCPEGV